jgi:hypothetical protein
MSSTRSSGFTGSTGCASSAPGDTAHPRGHTNLPTMMIAEREAELIRFASPRRIVRGELASPRR